jgi:hypothetical protein
MQTEIMSRDKTFNMRLTPEEWERFEAVAEGYSLPVASMLRMLVKEKWDEGIAQGLDNMAKTAGLPEMIDEAFALNGKKPLNLAQMKELRALLAAKRAGVPVSLPRGHYLEGASFILKPKAKRK